MSQDSYPQVKWKVIRKRKRNDEISDYMDTKEPFFGPPRVKSKHTLFGGMKSNDDMSTVLSKQITGTVLLE